MALLPLTLLLCGLLQGCGYSLRGSDVITATYPSLYLEYQQPNSEFSRLMSRSLAVANVDLATSPGTAPTLILGPEVRANRPVSINPRARAAQYEVRLSVTMALTQDGNVLIAPQTLVVERNYFEDIENLAGNREEVEIILDEMRRDLVNRVMRRLAAGQ